MTVKKNVHPAIVVLCGLCVLLLLCCGLGTLTTLVGHGPATPTSNTNLGLATTPSRTPASLGGPAVPLPTLVVVPTTTVAVPTTTTSRPRTTTTTLKKKPSTCGAPANPYGFTFCGGSYIYSPPADICSYIDCIPSFWDGRGYVIECVDGMFGKSGGIQGSCSHHGGNKQPLYKP
jgi:hypothetical protein